MSNDNQVVYIIDTSDFPFSSIFAGTALPSPTSDGAVVVNIIDQCLLLRLKTRDHSWNHALIEIEKFVRVDVSSCVCVRLLLPSN